MKRLFKNSFKNHSSASGLKRNEIVWEVWGKNRCYTALKKDELHTQDGKKEANCSGGFLLEERNSPLQTTIFKRVAGENRVRILRQEGGRKRSRELETKDQLSRAITFRSSSVFVSKIKNKKQVFETQRFLGTTPRNADFGRSIEQRQRRYWGRPLNFWNIFVYLLSGGCVEVWGQFVGVVLFFHCGGTEMELGLSVLGQTPLFAGLFC